MIWLTAYRLSSIAEGSRRLEAEMGDHEALMLLHTLLPLDCSADFFIHLKTTYPQMIPFLVRLVPLCPLATKKMPNRHYHKPITWKPFFYRFFLPRHVKFTRSSFI